MRTRALSAVCMLIGGLALARADDPPPKPEPKPAAPALDRVELDKRLAHVAHDTSLAGSELWKRDTKEGVEGCFRLYQGALMAIQPMLDHRPKLAALVKDKLDRAKDLKPGEGAFVLREALDAIQAETAGALIPPKKVALWERLGGEKVIRATVHDFIAAAAKDPKLDLTRGGKFKLDDKATARLEDVMVELMSEIGGGPLPYTGGDVPKALAGTKITDAEYDALLGHLEAALKKNKVGAAEVEELSKLAKLVRPGIVGQ